MTDEHQIPPHVQLIQMATSGWVARIIYAAAMLGLADQLTDGPKSAAELAESVGAHAPSLHRLMRTLASLGVLAERKEQRYALTTLGEALKANAPGSAKTTVLTFGSPWAESAWDHLVYCVQTGKTGFEKQHGMSFFDYFSRHPEAASMFNETMVGFHSQEPPAIAAAYDFSGFNTIVDVGGGTGNLLSAILNHYADPRGVLFDLPHVIAEAPALLKTKGISYRVKIEAGDFFESVPTGGDAYVLSHIIHDWNEDQCLTILRNIRRIMNSAGRLLIAEMVLPAGDTPHPGKMLDIGMLVWPGGQERTLAEYDQLLSKAGFQLTRAIPTESAVSVVEAIPA
jgi:hypothetical protein